MLYILHMVIIAYTNCNGSNTIQMNTSTGSNAHVMHNAHFRHAKRASYVIREREHIA
jgi:hypothetical protein